MARPCTMCASLSVLVDLQAENNNFSFFALSLRADLFSLVVHVTWK